jgi:hypothetical protein
VRQCSERIRIIKVNRKTLSLFGARDLDHLMTNLGRVIRDDAFTSHIDELAQLWGGLTTFSSTRSTIRSTATVSTSSSAPTSFPVMKRAGIAS